jgi:hypothetical protein
VVNMAGPIFQSPVVPGSLSILSGKRRRHLSKRRELYGAVGRLYGPTPSASGDFNKDGIPDLIMTAYTSGTGGPQDTGSALVVFIGKGDGTFKPGVLITNGFRT